MSWLGVNLNDSLSSLKGQLSNFTRDVLSEDFVEGEDDDTQVVVSRDRIKELESLCQLQKHELEESKRARSEVEERLQAANIHAAHTSKVLRQQLQEAEDKLRVLTEKSVEWGWQPEDSNHAQNHDGAQNHEWVDGLQAINHHNHVSPSSNSTELHNQQLSRRVEELERELGSLRDAHQEQVAALQDQHRQQLLALRQQDGAQTMETQSPAVNANIEQSDDGLPEQSARSKETAWAQVRTQLEKEKEQLSSRVELLQRQVQQLKLKNEEASQLEQKLSSLTDECSRLKKENEEHVKNLEELDSQHQEAVEQILEQKNSLKQEMQTQKMAHDQLAEQVAQYQAEKLRLEAEIKQVQSEAVNIKENNNTSLSSMKGQLESVTRDNDDLKSQLACLTNEESALKEKFRQLSLERDQMSGKKDELEKELCKLKEENTSKISGEQHILELETVQKQCLELKESNSQLQSTVENITEELKNLKVSEADAHMSLKVSDEKRHIAEAEIVSLNSKISSITEQVSKFKANEADRKSQQEKEREGQQQPDELKKLEIEKNKLEQDLKTANLATQDAKSRTEILESELQAKVQELDISNERISELQTKLKHMDSEVTKYRKHKKDDHEHLKKMLTAHNLEITSSMESDIHKVAELVRDSVWQRDTLERHVSSLAQELREKNDQLQESETTRVDLERECEDLRDQLEEIQKGVRPQPEGSSRGLPTIEEESEGCAEGDGEGGGQADGREQVKNSNDVLQQERASQIEALHAQIEALSEARRNLETEVANVRAEKETLQGQLREAESRTGNLLNLETEAVSLRVEKNALEVRLASLTQQVDLETVTLKDERDTLEEQVSALEENISRLQAEMALNKHERDSIGQQLLTQYEIQERREATIRVLEGEIEGLKDTLRERFAGNNSNSEALVQLQAKETKLLEELNSLRSQLIFKDDKIDELSQGLEQIRNIFDVEGLHPDRFHQHIQKTYQALQSRVKEQELNIEELKKAVQNEKDQSNRSNSLLESECSLREQKEQEGNLLKEKLEKNEMEVFQLREKVEELSGEPTMKEGEILKLQEQCKHLESEKNEALSSLQQNTTELVSVKQEMSELLKIIASEKESLLNLQEEKEALVASNEQKIAELNSKNQVVEEKLVKLTKDMECEIESRDTRITALQDQLMQLQHNNASVESFVVETDRLAKQEKILKDENDRLLQEKKTLQEEKDNLSAENKEAISARDVAVQQLGSLQAERDQMIATLTQKHQESVTYHAEIQRLMQVLNRTAQATADEKSSLTTKLRESEASLTESQAYVAKLREELDGLNRVKEDLQKNVADDIVKKTELAGLRKEIETLQTKHRSVEQERDQLRKANSHFNTQYQDQSKELNTLREKEGRLASECERLRQHLVAVEESYTAEAIKAEEREGTLRSTLGKMEEKLNNHSSFYNSASQRASVQVDALQEQLREVSLKRDDAVLRLHAAEELAEQHQQSLATLQQVLQDFQKGQVREISEATERTRRQLEEEQENSKSVYAQVNSLKAQLAEVQSALAAASRLGEQLDKKEQMIVALKAQVTSQEEVAQRARDEVICLKTSSEGKIEKTLLRNLLVGYFATPIDKRQEVLRVIAEVLDFSGEERSRTGIDIQGRSWLSSIANFLAPPASNVQVTSKVDVLDHTSLSQAFIRFLEDESTPRPQPRLPAVQMAQQTEEKAEKKAQAKAQAAANKINPFVSAGEATSTPTSSESRNSPLLAAASAPPTLPTFTPLAPVSSPIIEVNPTTPTASASGVTSPVSTNKYLTNLLGSDGTVREQGK